MPVVVTATKNCSSYEESRATKAAHLSSSKVSFVAQGNSFVCVVCRMGPGSEMNAVGLDVVLPLRQRTPVLAFKFGTRAYSFSLSRCKEFDGIEGCSSLVVHPHARPRRSIGMGKAKDVPTRDIVLLPFGETNDVDMSQLPTRHLAAHGQPQLDEDDAVAHEARLEE